MCEVCRQTPCHPQCPNADEQKPLCECDFCGSEIWEADDGYILDDGTICCFKCMDGLSEDWNDNFRDRFCSDEE